ncbi:PREDICTED: alpha-(1,3)-fucosyltransferase B-like [Bactrocera latifrons]|uniref:alpha-(1,3)-fucosyltransferase B-like n=1 Tax=Bactrocera latifrons TaxID=174628 RepID=UPI0008DCEBF5|nr:PREDICTED: alpha-(1,3)-fucosyltransferase B-like [Bactrocera latifrons]
MSYWWPFRSRYLPLTFGKRAVLLVAFLSCLLIIWYFGCNSHPICKRDKLARNDGSVPCIVLWWTNIGAEKITFDDILCGYNTCAVTSNRKYLPQAKAILFYASSLNWHDLPLPRQPEQIWALLHEESPRNVLEFLFEETLQHFNYTSTFSRYSDFPLTINALPNITEITNPKYVVTIGRKNVARNNLAPILFLQSDCSTMSGRTNYVEELMQHIPIDSYGSCLNNRQMPDSLQTDFLNKLYTEEMYRFIGQYKFMISIENGVCEDYITEKYWRPLIAGTVPIYFGSPSIRDWEPYNHSTIYITDYQSPKELAKYLLELDRNDSEYVKYLQHKYNQIMPITNQRLIEEFYVRTEETMFFTKFACQVLQALLAQNAKTKMANRLHYNCPLPLPYPAMERPPTEIHSWNSLLKRANCMAKSIDELLHINRVFTEGELHDLTNSKIENELC